MAIFSKTSSRSHPEALLDYNAICSPIQMRNRTCLTRTSFENRFGLATCSRPEGSRFQPNPLRLVTYPIRGLLGTEISFVLPVIQDLLRSIHTSRLSGTNRVNE